MKLTLTSEQRFARTPDGAIWTPDLSPYAFWGRYLEVFDRVQVIGRVRDVDSVSPGWLRSDGENVEFHAVPHYHGPLQYVLKSPLVHRSVARSVGRDSAVLLRVSTSQIGNLVWSHLQRAKQPYGVHVVGDAWDAFAPGTLSHPLRPFFRWWYTRTLERECAAATGAMYVTTEALQRRYPCNGFTTPCTDVEIHDDDLRPRSRPTPAAGQPLRVLMVGSMARLYKGHDVLIDALPACLAAGLDLRVTFVGDGEHRAAFAERVARLGLAERVTFTGQLPGRRAVQAEYERADLLVMPSRTEGLPRALIEAMAAGLPSVGTRVGGIPELLSADCLVEPDDVAGLANKIIEVVRAPGRMAALSARNVEVAAQYRTTLQRERLRWFLTTLKQATQSWLAQRGN